MSYRPDQAIKIGNVIIKIKPNVEGRRKIMILAPSEDLIDEVEPKEWDELIQETVC